MDVIERDSLQQNAHRKGEAIRSGLKSLSAKYPVIGDVRGQGLLLGVEVISQGESRMPAGKQARWIINEMCQGGVLIGLTGPNRKERNVLKIRPPMVFDENGVDILLSTLEDTLRRVPAIKE